MKTNVIDRSKVNVEKFESKIKKTDGCWLWLGTRNPGGYGFFQVGKEHVGAHRVSYELFNGPITEGMIICHTCDNPTCVNPNHLFQGTNLDNARDMLRKGRRHNSSGDKNPKAKLDNTSVLIMREAYRSGYKVKDIMRYFRLSRTYTYNVCKGIGWNHIYNK